MTSHEITGRLTPLPPFDFRHSLAFLEEFTPTQREQRIEELALTKPIVAAGQPLLCTLRSAGSVESPALDYTLRAERPITPEVQRAAADRAAFFLSLADDLRPFYAIAAHDAAFQPIVRKVYGYHQVKFLTPFENACWAVLTQRTQMSAARAAKDKLVQAFGLSLTLDDQTHQTFPEPQALAAASPADLMAYTPTTRQASYLHAVATAFADADEGWLRAAPTTDVLAWLQAIKGIGAWSAEFVLVRGLGRMDYAPLTERRLLEEAAKIYGDNAREPDALALLAERYGAYSGYWAHYLRVAA